MRISTAYQYDTYTSQINTTFENLYDIQQQVSSGKRINKLSDDPFGVTNVLTQTSIKSSLTQYTKNLSTATTSLNFTDSTLSDSSDVMTQAYQLALQGANSSTDQTSRNAMAAQVDQLQQHLVDLANSRGANGQYIFGGQKNDSAPFSLTSTGITYNGDNGNIVVETSATSTMPITTPGQTLYTDAYNRLENLKNNLLGGNISALSGTSVDELKKSTDDFTQARGNVGARLQTVNQLTDENNRRTDELTKSISDTQDVDMAEAISKYQLAQTAYQAALSLSSHGLKLSLMDYIQ